MVNLLLITLSILVEVLQRVHYRKYCTRVAVERLIWHETKLSAILASRPCPCPIFPVVHERNWYFNWYIVMHYYGAPFQFGTFILYGFKYQSRLGSREGGGGWRERGGGWRERGGGGVPASN